jgi:hypothetical protein
VIFNLPSKKSQEEIFGSESGELSGAQFSRVPTKFIHDLREKMEKEYLTL